MPAAAESHSACRNYPAASVASLNKKGRSAVTERPLGQPTYLFLPLFFDFLAFLKSPPRASLAARVAFI
jgi:hypothetical protein